MAENKRDNTEDVRKEAKKILDRFAGALEKVRIKAKEAKKEAGGFRYEGEVAGGEMDFRARMFANAPNKDENCIIAEKKEWA